MKRRCFLWKEKAARYGTHGTLGHTRILVRLAGSLHLVNPFSPVGPLYNDVVLYNSKVVLAVATNTIGIRRTGETGCDRKPRYWRLVI
mgnify:CR=1 FL=1